MYDVMLAAFINRMHKHKLKHKHYVYGTRLK